MEDRGLIQEGHYMEKVDLGLSSIDLKKESLQTGVIDHEHNITRCKIFQDALDADVKYAIRRKELVERSKS